ncbi:hypothetical protein LY76DRAFT_323564 [Colletotrichum caudatum]|nr:hypothetical protein LY76DRAFT_323564 [Colletotrichum caudatum]
METPEETMGNISSVCDSGSLKTLSDLLTVPRTFILIASGRYRVLIAASRRKTRNTGIVAAMMVIAVSAAAQTVSSAAPSDYRVSIGLLQS